MKNKHTFYYLTTQQGSLTIQDGSQCIQHNNIWSQPSVSTIWTNSGLNPFSPASEEMYHQV